MESNMISIVGLIVSLFAAIAAWIHLWPGFLSPFFIRILGKTVKLDDYERGYLESLRDDLERKNLRSNWSNKNYVDVDTELKYIHIPISCYLPKLIDPRLKEQEFNNLSNIEKIDSSQGRNFKSLSSAIDGADDKAVVVIAPPGNGKTVSLRNLSINKINDRLSKKTNIIPIFVNLGYYTGFDDDGSVENFDVFLEKYFSSQGYLKTFLANRQWESLLKRGHCQFFLDGIDEMPRKPNEYDIRSQKISEFINNWPSISFILSCREQDYNRNLPFQQILIKPFDEKHIKKYLKKYFPSKEYRGIFLRLRETIGIFELCKNPFYLNLVCLFVARHNEIPNNKVKLFDSIIEWFYIRELEKQNSQITFDDFKSSIAKLAYYVAVEKMVTTIDSNEYIRSINYDENSHLLVDTVEFAKNGGFIDYNETTQEIRFIHNRFLEYFSSHYILKNYKKDANVLPSNAFTNLWWKETVLFIAGLDFQSDYLVNMIMAEREILEWQNSTIEKYLKLEMLLLAFECVLVSQAHNQSLHFNLKNQLLLKYATGNTLEKIKILMAFRFDKTEEIIKFFKNSLSDRSILVSEKAFFILSENALKIQMNPSGIIKMFFRLSIEGRLINVFIPITKSASYSKLIRLFLPLYFVLLILNIASIGIAVYVIYYFFNFAFTRMEFSFSTECLGCLTSLIIGIGIIIFCFMKNNYPILKRFFYTAPIAIMIRYLVFYIPDVFIVRMLASLVGWTFYKVHKHIFKRVNNSPFDSLSLSLAVCGFFSVALFYNLINFNINVFELTFNSINFSFSNNDIGIYLSLGLLLIISITVISFIFF